MPNDYPALVQAPGEQPPAGLMSPTPPANRQYGVIIRTRGQLAAFLQDSGAFTAEARVAYAQDHTPAQIAAEEARRLSRNQTEAIGRLPVLPERAGSINNFSPALFFALSGSNDRPPQV